MRQITVEVADRELTADVTFRTQEQIEERVDTMDFFRAAGEGKAKASHAAWIIYITTLAKCASVRSTTTSAHALPPCA